MLYGVDPKLWQLVLVVVKTSYELVTLATADEYTGTVLRFGSATELLP